MKKIVLFLFIYFLSINVKAQTIEWHLSNPELPMIMLDEDLEPLVSDTNIFPAMYEIIKVISENGNYITYSQGNDSLIITILCQVAGQRIACRVIKTPTRLIIQDGIIIPEKHEPEEYEFNQLIFYSNLGLLLFLLPLIKFRNHEIIHKRRIS